MDHAAQRPNHGFMKRSDKSQRRRERLVHAEQLRQRNRDESLQKRRTGPEAEPEAPSHVRRLFALDASDSLSLDLCLSVSLSVSLCLSPRLSL
jgi:hypothetical protein